MSRRAFPWLVLAVGVYEALVVSFALTSHTLLESLHLALLWILAAGGLVVGTVVFLLLPTLVHEVGHLVAGWLAGCRFLEVVVGPFQVTRTGKKLSFTINKGQWNSGHVRMCPLGHLWLRERLMVLTLGGPAGDIILFFSTSLIAKSLWERDSATTGHGFSWIYLLLMFPIIGSLRHLMSYNADYEGHSDATIMKRYRAPDGRAIAAAHAVHINWYAGQRPRDWDARLLREAYDERSQHHDRALALILRYFAALDSGQVDAADALLKRLHSEIQGMEDESKKWYEALLAHEEVFVDVLLDRPFDPSTELPELDESFGDELFHRGEIAVAIASGRLEDARSMIQESRQHILDRPHVTDADRASFEWLDRLESKIGTPHSP